MVLLGGERRSSATSARFGRRWFARAPASRWDSSGSAGWARSSSWPPRSSDGSPRAARTFESTTSWPPSGCSSSRRSWGPGREAGSSSGFGIRSLPRPITTSPTPTTSTPRPPPSSGSWGSSRAPFVACLALLVRNAMRDPDPVRRRWAWAAAFGLIYFAAHQLLDFYRTCRRSCSPRRCRSPGWMPRHPRHRRSDNRALADRVRSPRRPHRDDARRGRLYRPHRHRAAGRDGIERRGPRERREVGGGGRRRAAAVAADPPGRRTR